MRYTVRIMSFSKYKVIFFILKTINLLTIISIDAEPIEVDDKDFRYISRQDLLQDHFVDGNVTSFSQFLFDVSRNQLIVGARDALYRLTLSLELYEKNVWEPSESIIETCRTKGASDENCHNYVMVLQNYGNQLYACGTHAFNPLCSWRQMDDLNITKLDKGVAKCPFNPHANITTLLTENGKLFVASPTDFSGTDPAILRTDISQEKDDSRIIRTDQYNSKWLNNPQFVGSFESDEFVYFVFREAAVEYINCGKIIYSRIARVCKSDPGGQRGSRDNWTSFAKARLNCSLPGDYPFYFNEVLSMQFSVEDSILFATFSTPENSIHASAICAFNLSAINAAFNGPFKHQETPTSLWERKELEHRNQFQCLLPSIRHDVLISSQRYQFMDEAIQPVTKHPLFVSKLEKITHIALDTIPSKLHNKVQVVFVATDKKVIKKLTILPRTKEMCVTEIWEPEIDTKSNILTMQFLKHTESLYIGTENSIVRIPAYHCARHNSKTNCIRSMDPYCGWNDLQQECTPPPNGDPLKRFWIQQSNECPILSSPINGGWSSWSDWFTCTQHSDDNRHESSNVDSCLCRTRSCNNPTPKNGGTSCKGTNVSVTNCTVHGKWTAWTEWSACSQSCGIAVKSRRRFCGNPAPAHNGRTCVGPDRLEMYCANLPPCPEPRPTAIDGGWGPWGSFSKCSSTCGTGFRLRRRNCDSPLPQNGGVECIGCSIDYEICNTQKCPERSAQGPWTPWLQFSNNATSTGERMEKRFRYYCKFNATDARVYKAKEENRICLHRTCHRVDEDSNNLNITESTSWSGCSTNCGSQQEKNNGSHEDAEISISGNTSTHLLFLLIVLLLASNILIYVYMKKKYSSIQHLKNIGSPCYDSYPNQYSSLPSKEDRSKVKRQSSFSGVAGANSKLLSNAHSSLAKSSNVTGHQMPKALSKCFIENDTATIKRNSHGLNNSRPVRCIDEDKF